MKQISPKILVWNLLCIFFLSLPSSAVPPLVVAGNLISNSDFETPVVAPGDFVVGVPSWVDDGGTFDTFTLGMGYYTSGENTGNQTAGFSNMSQSVIGTIMGQSYDIAYYVSDEYDTPITFFGGVPLLGGATAMSSFNPNYTLFTFSNVLAPSNNATLAFTTTFFAQIDDVSLVASSVPELDTSGCRLPLALVILAFLMLGDIRSKRVPRRTILAC